MRETSKSNETKQTAFSKPSYHFFFLVEVFPSVFCLFDISKFALSPKPVWIAVVKLLPARGMILPGSSGGCLWDHKAAPKTLTMHLTGLRVDK